VTDVLQIIAVLLAALLVLLALPVTVAFRINRRKEIKGKVIVHWFFGLVRFRISVPGRPKAEPRPKRVPGKKTGKRKPGAKLRRTFTLLKHSPFRRRTIRFIKGLLQATHTRGLYCRLRIGLDDPADTGLLWGVLGPVAGIAASFRCAEVRIEPEFADPVLEVESHGEFRLIPLQFIGLVSAFVLSPATMHAWFTLRRSHT
jgi:hypothetical protein